MEPGSSEDEEQQRLEESQTVVIAEEDLRPSIWHEMRVSEDWWAVWCGAFLLLLMFSIVWFSRPSDFLTKLNTDEVISITNPLKQYMSKPGKWTDNPVHAFIKPAAAEGKKAVNTLPGMLGAFALIGALFAGAAALRGTSATKFLRAFCAVFLLAVFAYVLSGQSVIRAYNLEYALWALLTGLIISNTIGTPEWMKPAIQTNFTSKRGWFCSALKFSCHGCSLSASPAYLYPGLSRPSSSSALSSSGKKC